MRRETLSPRPVPVDFELTKGVKRRSASLGSMPGPLSVTVNSTWPFIARWTASVPTIWHGVQGIEIQIHEYAKNLIGIDESVDAVAGQSTLDDHALLAGPALHESDAAANNLAQIASLPPTLVWPREIEERLHLGL